MICTSSHKRQMKRSLKFLIIGAAAALVATVALIATLTGSKEPLTAKGFAAAMEKNGYEVINVKEQFARYDHVKSAYIAIDGQGGQQIEFYVLSGADTASAFFDNNRSLFEETKGSIVSESSVSGKNHAKYTLSSGGTYKVISMIDNTAVYADVEDSCKDEVKEILKELGY